MMSNSIVYANSGKKRSFIQYSLDNQFPIENIPFGVYLSGETKKVGVAIGEYIVDLSALIADGHLKYISERGQQSLKQSNLNQFFQLSAQERTTIRSNIQGLLEEGSYLKSEMDKYLVRQDSVKMELPVDIGDYTDFYASRNHAENVGEMFRGKENKLMPNWLHMPIGYHGRSSSVNVEKTVVRPAGQLDHSVFGLENKLDFELELSIIIAGQTNKMGTPIDINQAASNIGGLCLMNDLSARSIQRIEYQPLGPFLGKNFSTVISPWVVLPEALKQFEVKRENQAGIVDYLKASSGLRFYDIPLQVYLQPRDSTERYLISESNTSNLYWSFEQMIAHHSIGGCNMRVGDLLASGTISGDNKNTQTGSLLELTWNGTQPLTLGPHKRTFLEDGDTIILTGGARDPETNQLIGFGEVQTTVLPRSI